MNGVVPTDPVTFICGVEWLLSTMLTDRGDADSESMELMPDELEDSALDSFSIARVSLVTAHCTGVGTGTGFTIVGSVAGVHSAKVLAGALCKFCAAMRDAYVPTGPAPAVCICGYTGVGCRRGVNPGIIALGITYVAPAVPRKLAACVLTVGAC